MSDILYTTDQGVFSYRVAGICIQDNQLLLQKPTNEDCFAFPGGHVDFGETNEETLMREFKEEIGASIAVGELVWLGENYFPWDDKPCHQICPYYRVTIQDEETPKSGMFMAKESIKGRSFTIEFHWIPFEKLQDIVLYPTNAVSLLKRLDSGVQHFVYRQ